MSNEKLKVTSISYVDDPEAADKWFAIYVDLLLEQMKKDKKKDKKQGGAVIYIRRGETK